MEIRKLNNSDIPAAKQLWMDAFGDSEAFVRFYFEHKFDLEFSMGAFDSGIMAGDLTMQNMTVRMRGSLWKTGFLAGCATRKDYRNRGVMKKLLYAQLAEMNEQGYALCHLHPFLHDFYRKFGWETVSFMKEARILPAGGGKAFLNSKFDPGDLWEMYLVFMQHADGNFLRSKEEMRIRIDEHLNDGGKIIAGSGGYAFYFVDSHELEVIELVWTTQSPQELLSPLGTYGVPVHCFLPDYVTSDLPGVISEYTMMRIVNAENLFARLQIDQDISFTLCIRDDFCEWNNRKFVLDFRKGKKSVRAYEGSAVDTEIDIGDLARLAAGKTEGTFGLLEKLFVPQKTCFFNTY